MHDFRRGASFFAILCVSVAPGCTLLIDLPEAADSNEDGGGSSSGGVSASGGTDSEAGPGTGGSGPRDAGSGGDSAAASGGTNSIDGSVSSGGTSAGGEDSGAGGCVAECDCDGDGVLARSCIGSDGDCDDDDPRVFPGQTAYFAEPRDTAEQRYDYDCDGTATPEPTLSCGALCETSTRGYESAAVSCGQTGAWGQCRAALPPLSAGCSFSVLEPDRPRGCR